MRVTVIATGFEHADGTFAPKASAAVTPADDIGAPLAGTQKPVKSGDISDIDEIFSIFKR